MKLRKNIGPGASKLLLLTLVSSGSLPATAVFADQPSLSEACQATMQRAQQDINGYLTNLARPEMQLQQRVLLSAREDFIRFLGSSSGARERPTFEEYLRYANDYNSGRYTSSTNPSLRWQGFDSFLNSYRRLNRLNMYVTSNPSLAYVRNARPVSAEADQNQLHLDYNENLLLPWQQLQVNGIEGRSLHEEPLFKACSSVKSENSGILGAGPTTMVFCTEINVNTGGIYGSPDGNPMAQLTLDNPHNHINGVPARAFEIQYINRQLAAANCPQFELPHLDPSQSSTLAPYYQAPTAEALQRRAAFFAPAPAVAEPQTHDDEAVTLPPLPGAAPAANARPVVAPDVAPVTNASQAIVPDAAPASVEAPQDGDGASADGGAHEEPAAEPSADEDAPTDNSENAP